ncbi:hypothetical protein PGT21_000035 [Puccinia graminis f. sp. tritici]|uniref:Uncharacterized protein n=1 Tax=Puccinia graminis f. sp. tritici TaxID=56615 RepID=A0A5B0N4W6_PUCGR|nr:hypothetical protein PGT21_000035 [Puccinia graminis f. sp. tritici]
MSIHINYLGHDLNHHLSLLSILLHPEDLNYLDFSHPATATTSASAHHHHNSNHQAALCQTEPSPRTSKSLPSPPYLSEVVARRPPLLTFANKPPPPPQQTTHQPNPLPRLGTNSSLQEPNPNRVCQSFYHPAIVLRVTPHVLKLNPDPVCQTLHPIYPTNKLHRNYQPSGLRSSRDNHHLRLFSILLHPEDLNYRDFSHPATATTSASENHHHNNHHQAALRLPSAKPPTAPLSPKSSLPVFRLSRDDLPFEPSLTSHHHRLSRPPTNQIPCHDLGLTPHCRNRTSTPFVKVSIIRFSFLFRLSRDDLVFKPLLITSPSPPTAGHLFTNHTTTTPPNSPHRLRTHSSSGQTEPSPRTTTPPNSPHRLATNPSSGQTEPSPRMSKSLPSPPYLSEVVARRPPLLTFANKPPPPPQQTTHQPNPLPRLGTNSSLQEPNPNPVCQSFYHPAIVLRVTPHVLKLNPDPVCQTLHPIYPTNKLHRNYQPSGLRSSRDNHHLRLFSILLHPEDLNYRDFSHPATATTSASENHHHNNHHQAALRLPSAKPPTAPPTREFNHSAPPVNQAKQAADIPLAYPITITMMFTPESTPLRNPPPAGKPANTTVTQFLPPHAYQQPSQLSNHQTKSSIIPIGTHPATPAPEERPVEPPEGSQSVTEVQYMVESMRVRRRHLKRVHAPFSGRAPNLDTFHQAYVDALEAFVTEGTRMLEEAEG